MIKDEQKQLAITKEGLEELKKAYNKALMEEEETFMFQNSKLYTGYAKYLIQYCEIRKDEL